MPYRICKSFEIENGHLLSKHPDHCRFPHGHSRRIEIVLEADSLDAAEMVCDFKAVAPLIQPYLETLDHALCANSADPHFPALRAAFGDRVVPFENEDPTTEVMAREIFRRLQAALDARRTPPGPPAPGATSYPIRPCVRLASVRLWETSSSWAEYSE